MTNRNPEADIYARELPTDVLNDLWSRWDNIVPAMITDLRDYAAAQPEVVWEMLPMVTDATLGTLLTPDMTMDDAIAVTEQHIRSNF
jgi:hypothetical protein